MMMMIRYDDRLTVIVSTFVASSALLFGCKKVLKQTIVEASSSVAILHHAVVVVLGIWAHWMYHDVLVYDGKVDLFHQNDVVPLSRFLVHLNIGFFIYDTTYIYFVEQPPVLANPYAWHHFVVTAGFLLADQGNVFALPAGIITYTMELGSLTYNFYAIYKNNLTYMIFFVTFGLSRILTIAGSLFLISETFSKPAEEVTPHAKWVPSAVFWILILLIVVNVFLVYHGNKEAVDGLVLRWRKNPPRFIRMLIRRGSEHRDGRKKVQ